MTNTMVASPRDALVSTSDLLREDLTLFRLAAHEKDFGDVTIFANRFCSDALMVEDDGARNQALFIGAVLRIVAEDVAQAAATLQSRSEDFEPETVDPLVKAALANLPGGPDDLARMSDAFFEFETNISGSQQSKHEATTLKSRKLGSFSPRTFLIDHYEANKDALALKGNWVVKGFLNEMARYSKVVTFDERDLATYLVLKMFAYAHDFALLEIHGFDGAMKARGEKWVTEERDALSTFLRSMREENGDNVWGTAAPLVVTYVSQWRRQWLRYGERREQPLLQLGVGPPEETSEKEPAGRRQKERRRS